MTKLIFERKGGLVEVREAGDRIDEALNLKKIGAGAAMAGAVGLHLLAKFAETIAPDAKKGDFSKKTEGLFQSVMNTIADMDPAKKARNEKILALKKRMNQFKELEAGNVTADTVLQVLGPVGELSEDEMKFLKASDAYWRAVGTYKKQLGAITDPKKFSGKIKSAYQIQKGAGRKAEPKAETEGKEDAE